MGASASRRSLVRVVDWTRTRRVPSARMLEACATFGLGVRAVSVRAASPARASREASALARAIRHAPITLIAGPSGCGKSVLLRQLVRELRRRRARCVALRVEACADAPSVLDALRLPVRRALGVLARAGLGDALLLVRRPRELSEGERWRFALARAMARCERAREKGAVLIIDEFLTPLDRDTACSIAIALARWARSFPDRACAPRVVCATAHEDVEAWLTPDIVVRPGRAHHAR